MSSDEVILGRTIQIFLVDGVPGGLVIASIHGWTGSVLVGTQSTFARLLARPEVDRSGIYILYGPDPQDDLKMRAYVGEADSVRERISQSAGARTFWESAVVVTTSDDALTKGHVRYLEARLIQIAQEADRVNLDNAQSPAAERRRLPEADRANMEAFLQNLRVILPVVGLDLLKATRQTKASRPSEEASLSSLNRPRFEIRHRSGVAAQAEEIEGEFIVLKGSMARKDSGNVGRGYINLKARLIDQGALRVMPDGTLYEFTRDFAFASPSAAAAIVLDRNANGRTEWKAIGTDLTYQAWQEQVATGEATPA